MKVVLIDGSDEIFGEKEIDDEQELQTLNNEASEATDGNLYWIPKPHEAGREPESRQPAERRGKEEGKQ